MKVVDGERIALLEDLDNNGQTCPVSFSSPPTNFRLYTTSIADGSGKYFVDYCARPGLIPTYTPTPTSTPTITNLPIVSMAGGTFASLEVSMVGVNNKLAGDVTVEGNSILKATRISGHPPSSASPQIAMTFKGTVEFVTEGGLTLEMSNIAVEFAQGGTAVVQSNFAATGGSQVSNKGTMVLTNSVGIFGDRNSKMTNTGTMNVNPGKSVTFTLPTVNDNGGVINLPADGTLVFKANFTNLVGSVNLNGATAKLVIEGSTARLKTVSGTGTLVVQTGGNVVFEDANIPVDVNVDGAQHTAAAHGRRLLAVAASDTSISGTGQVANTMTVKTAKVVVDCAANEMKTGADLILDATAELHFLNVDQSCAALMVSGALNSNAQAVYITLKSDYTPSLSSVVTLVNAQTRTGTPNPPPRLTSEPGESG